MKRYRVYEAFRNTGGGVEGCGAGWSYIDAETAKDAAKAFAGNYRWMYDDSVVVATDDNGDSYHLDFSEVHHER